MAFCMFLECLKNWMSMSMEDRCCQRNMVQVRRVIEDSCMVNIRYLRHYGLDLLKKVYDAKVRIQ
jgi:hypothetical protein